MNRKPQPLLPMPPWVLAGLLVGCGLVALYLLPSKRALLERQVRDGAAQSALKTLQGLSPQERAEDPAYYALTEIQLKRRLLDLKDGAALDRQLGAAAQASAQFGFPQDFLPEFLELIPLHPRAMDALETLRPHLAVMPASVRQSVYGALAAKALAANQPATAAEIYAPFWASDPPAEATTLEMARLWRLAGKPDRSLAAVETFARQSGNLLERSRALARVRVDLLRETSQAAPAFLATRELYAVSSPDERDALFDLLVITARESNHSADIVPEAQRRAEARPDDAKSWQLLADLALAASDHALALRSCQKLAILEPENARNFFQLGQLHEWSKQPSVAFDFFLKALRLRDPSAIGRLVALNSGLYRDAELVEALTAMEEFVLKSNHGPDLARLQAGFGNFEQAVESYDRLVREQPGLLPLLKEYGRLLIDLSEYEKAGQIFRQAEALHKEDAGVQKALAEIHFRLGDFEGAFQRYGRLAEAGLDDAAVEHYITLAESLGRLESVTVGLQEKLKNSDAVTARDYQRLAYFHNLRGRTAAMREVLLAGVARFPDSAVLRLQAAYALSDSRQFLEASRMLQPHPDLRSSADLARFYLGLLVQAPDHRAAEQFLASGLDPEMLASPELMEIQAEILEANQKFAAAAAVYEKLQQRDPKNLRHIMSRARLLLAVGQAKDAEAVIRPFLENATPELWKFAAQIYAACGRYNSAETYQRQFLATNPPEAAQAWGFLGDILLARGDKTSARRAYERGVSEMWRAAQNVRR